MDPINALATPGTLPMHTGAMTSMNARQTTQAANKSAPITLDHSNAVATSDTMSTALIAMILTNAPLIPMAVIRLARIVTDLSSALVTPGIYLKENDALTSMNALTRHTIANKNA